MKISAVIFDLDGTLVQTEILKAISYAKAVVSLRPGDIEASIVVKAFKDVVGLSRKDVAERIMSRFGLEEMSRQKMEEFDVASPWQAFVQIRLNIYEDMLLDPEVLLHYRCPYNLNLLNWAKKKGLKTALATMSHFKQAHKVLDILGIRKSFDFIATRDDVEYGKPDPEIYLLVAQELQILPEESLVIEDSVSGVKSAVAAGMRCIAVTSEFTKQKVHESKLINKHLIVDDPKFLKGTALSLIDSTGK